MSQTRQIRKRAAFVVALNRMPEREVHKSHASKDTPLGVEYLSDAEIEGIGLSRGTIAVPITRKRRRAMARAVARRVVGVEL